MKNTIEISGSPGDPLSTGRVGSAGSEEDPMASNVRGSVIRGSVASRNARRSVSQRHLIHLLTEQITALGEDLVIVDLGGGTGGVASTLAAAGHQVTVVDPSPDALANTQRRAAEIGLSDRVRAIQGDSDNLANLIEPDSVDVVLCHQVLQTVTGTSHVLEVISQVLSPGGMLSLLIQQRYPRVLKAAMAGDFAGATDLLENTDLLDGANLVPLVKEAGFLVAATHGIGVLADWVPQAELEGRSDELLALESRASEYSEYAAVAPRLHLCAHWK